MKYIDADKLIAEIERQIAILDKELKPAAEEDFVSSWASTAKNKRVALQSILATVTSLQQEQSDLPSGEDVMTMCNQILIDWVKEGKTPEEVESREEAHSRFFELYDEYLMQEQPEGGCSEKPNNLLRKQEQPEVDIRKELDRLELMGSNDARDIQTIEKIESL